MGPGDLVPAWAGGTAPSKKDSRQAITTVEAYRSIFTAMSQSGVKRFIATGTPSYADPSDKFNLTKLFVVSLVKILLHDIYRDINNSYNLMATPEWKEKIDWSWFRLPFVGNY